MLRHRVALIAPSRRRAGAVAGHHGQAARPVGTGQQQHARADAVLGRIQGEQAGLPLGGIAGIEQDPVAVLRDAAVGEGEHVVGRGQRLGHGQRRHVDHEQAVLVGGKVGLAVGHVQLLAIGRDRQARRIAVVDARGVDGRGQRVGLRLDHDLLERLQRAGIEHVDHRIALVDAAGARHGRLVRLVAVGIELAGADRQGEAPVVLLARTGVATTRLLAVSIANSVAVVVGLNDVTPYG